MSSRKPKKSQKLGSSRRYRNRNRDIDDDGFPDPGNEDHDSEQSQLHTVSENQASNESSLFHSDQPVVCTNPNTSLFELSPHPQPQDAKGLLAQAEVTSKKRKMGSTRKGNRNFTFEGIDEGEPEYRVQLSEGIRHEQGVTVESSIKEDRGKEHQTSLLDCAPSQASEHEISILQEEHLAFGTVMHNKDNRRNDEHQHLEAALQSKPIDISSFELNQSKEADNDKSSMAEHTVLKTEDDQSSLKLISRDIQEDKQERKDVDTIEGHSVDGIGQEIQGQEVTGSASLINEHQHGIQVVWKNVTTETSTEDENTVDLCLEHKEDTIKVTKENTDKSKSTEFRENIDEYKEVSVVYHTTDNDLDEGVGATRLNQAMEPDIDIISPLKLKDQEVEMSSDQFLSYEVKFPCGNEIKCYREEQYGLSEARCWTRESSAHEDITKKVVDMHYDEEEKYREIGTEREVGNTGLQSTTSNQLLFSKMLEFITESELIPPETLYGETETSNLQHNNPGEFLTELEMQSKDRVSSDQILENVIKDRSEFLDIETTVIEEESKEIYVGSTESFTKKDISEKCLVNPTNREAEAKQFESTSQIVYMQESRLGQNDAIAENVRLSHSENNEINSTQMSISGLISGDDQKNSFKAMKETIRVQSLEESHLISDDGKLNFILETCYPRFSESLDIKEPEAEQTDEDVIASQEYNEPQQYISTKVINTKQECNVLDKEDEETVMVKNICRGVATTNLVLSDKAEHPVDTNVLKLQSRTEVAESIVHIINEQAILEGGKESQPISLEDPKQNNYPDSWGQSKSSKYTEFATVTINTGHLMTSAEPMDASEVVQLPEVCILKATTTHIQDEGHILINTKSSKRKMGSMRRSLGRKREEKDEEEDMHGEEKNIGLTDSSILLEKDNDKGEETNDGPTEKITREDIAKYSQQYTYSELSSTTSFPQTTIEHPSPATEHPDFKKDDGNSIETTEKTNAEIQTQTKKKKKIGSTRRPHGRHQLHAGGEEEEEWKVLEKTEEIEHQIISEASISNLLTESQTTVSEESHDIHHSPTEQRGISVAPTILSNKIGQIHTVVSDEVSNAEGLTDIELHKKIELNQVKDAEPMVLNEQVIQDNIFTEHVLLAAKKHGNESPDHESVSEVNVHLTCDQVEFIPETQVMSDMEMETENIHAFVPEQNQNISEEHLEDPANRESEPEEQESTSTFVQIQESKSSQDLDQTGTNTEVIKEENNGTEEGLNAGLTEDFTKEDITTVHSQQYMHYELSSQTTDLGLTTMEHPSPATEHPGRDQLRAGGEEEDWNNLENTEEIEHQIIPQAPTSNLLTEAQNTMSKASLDIHDSPATAEQRYVIKSEAEIVTGGIEVAPVVCDEVSNTEGMTDITESHEKTGVNEEIIAESILLNEQDIQDSTFTEHGSLAVKMHGIVSPDHESASEVGDFKKDDENSIETMEKTNAETQIQMKKKKKIGSTRRPHGRHQQCAGREEEEWKDLENKDIEQQTHESPVASEEKQTVKSEDEIMTGGIDVAPATSSVEDQNHTVVSDEVSNEEGLTAIIKIHEKPRVNEKKDAMSMLLNKQEIEDDTFTEHLSLAVKKHGNESPDHERVSKVNVHFTCDQVELETQVMSDMQMNTENIHAFVPEKDQDISKENLEDPANRESEPEQQESTSTFIQIQESKSSQDLDQTGTNTEVIEGENNETEEILNASLTEDFTKEDITTVHSQQYMHYELSSQTTDLDLTPMEHPLTATEHPDFKKDDGNSIEAIEKTNAEIQSQTKKKKKIGSTRRPHGRHQLRAGGEEEEWKDLENLGEIEHQIITQAPTSNLLTESQNSVSEGSHDIHDSLVTTEQKQLSKSEAETRTGGINVPPTILSTEADQIKTVVSNEVSNTEGMTDIIESQEITGVNEERIAESILLNVQDIQDGTFTEHGSLAVKTHDNESPDNESASEVDDFKKDDENSIETMEKTNVEIDIQTKKKKKFGSTRRPHGRHLPHAREGEEEWKDLENKDIEQQTHESPVTSKEKQIIKSEDEIMTGGIDVAPATSPVEDQNHTVVSDEVSNEEGLTDIIKIHEKPRVNEEKDAMSMLLNKQEIEDDIFTEDLSLAVKKHGNESPDHESVSKVNVHFTCDQVELETQVTSDMQINTENIHAFESEQDQNISKEHVEHPSNRESEPEQQESTSTFIQIQESKSSQDLDQTGTNTEVIEEKNNETGEGLNAGLTEDFTKEVITTVHSQQYMHYELSSPTTDLGLTTMQHPSTATEHPDFKEDDGNSIEAIEKTNAEIQSQTKKKKKIGSTRRPHGRHQLRAGGEEEEWKDLENLGEIEHQIITQAPTSNLLTESQNSVSEGSHDIHDSLVTTEQKQLSKSEAETRTGGINVPPTILSTEADQIKTVVSNEVSNTEGMTDIIESQEITGVNEERIAESILLNVQDIQDGTFTEHGSLAVKTHDNESPDNESANEVDDFKKDDENSIETMEKTNVEIDIQTKKKKKFGSTRRPHGRHLPHAREGEEEWKDLENKDIEQQTHESPVTSKEKQIIKSEDEIMTGGIDVAPATSPVEDQNHTVVSDEVSNEEGLTDIIKIHEKPRVNEEKDAMSMLLNKQEIEDDIFTEDLSLAVKKHGNESPDHESVSKVNVHFTCDQVELETQVTSDMQINTENIHAFESEQDQNISKEHVEHPSNRESEPEQQESTSTFIQIQESKSSQDLDQTGTNTEVIEEKNNETGEGLNAGLTEDFTKEVITTVHSQQYMHYELSSPTTDLGLTTMQHPSTATEHPDFKEDDGNSIEAIEKTNAEIQSQTKKKKKIGSTRRPHGRHQLRAGGEEEEWKDLENLGEIEQQIITQAPTSNLLTESQNSVSEDSHDIHDSPVTTEQKQLIKSEAEIRIEGVNTPPTILSTEVDQINMVVSSEVSNAEGLSDIIELHEKLGMNEEKDAESMLLNAQEIQDDTFKEHVSLAVKKHGNESPDHESASKVGDFKKDDKNCIETMETTNEEIHIQTKKKKKIGSTRRPHGRHQLRGGEEEGEWKDQENTEEIEHQNIAQTATSTVLTDSQSTISEEFQDIHDSLVTTEQQQIIKSEVKIMTAGINVAPAISSNEVDQIRTVVSDDISNTKGLTDIIEIREKPGVNEEKDAESMVLNKQEIEDRTFPEHVSLAVKKHCNESPDHENVSGLHVHFTCGPMELIPETQVKSDMKMDTENIHTFIPDQNQSQEYLEHPSNRESEPEQQESTSTFIQIQESKSSQDLDQTGTNTEVIEEKNNETGEGLNANLTEDFTKEDITTVHSQQYMHYELSPQTTDLGLSTMEHPSPATEHPDFKKDDGNSIEAIEKTNAEIQTQTKKKKKIGSTRRPHGRHQLRAGGEEEDWRDLENTEEIDHQIITQAPISNLLTESQRTMTEESQDMHDSPENIYAFVSEQHKNISEEHLEDPTNRESEPEEQESTSTFIQIQESKSSQDLDQTGTNTKFIEEKNNETGEGLNASLTKDFTKEDITTVHSQQYMHYELSSQTTDLGLTTMEHPSPATEHPDFKKDDGNSIEAIEKTNAEIQTRTKKKKKIGSTRRPHGRHQLRSGGEEEDWRDLENTEEIDHQIITQAPISNLLTESQRTMTEESQDMHDSPENIYAFVSEQNKNISEEHLEDPTNRESEPEEQESTSTFIQIQESKSSQDLDQTGTNTEVIEEENNETGEGLNASLTKDFTKENITTVHSQQYMHHELSSPTTDLDLTTMQHPSSATEHPDFKKDDGNRIEAIEKTNAEIQSQTKKKKKIGSTRRPHGRHQLRAGGEEEEWKDLENLGEIEHQIITQAPTSNLLTESQNSVSEDSHDIHDSPVTTEQKQLIKSEAEIRIEGVNTPPTILSTEVDQINMVVSSEVSNAEGLSDIIELHEKLGMNEEKDAESMLLNAQEIQDDTFKEHVSLAVKKHGNESPDHESASKVGDFKKDDKNCIETMETSNEEIHIQTKKKKKIGSTRRPHGRHQLRGGEEEGEWKDQENTEEIEHQNIAQTATSTVLTESQSTISEESQDIYDSPVTTEQQQIIKSEVKIMTAGINVAPAISSNEVDQIHTVVSDDISNTKGLTDIIEIREKPGVNEEKDAESMVLNKQEIEDRTFPEHVSLAVKKHCNESPDHENVSGLHVHFTCGPMELIPETQVKSDMKMDTENIHTFIPDQNQSQEYLEHPSNRESEPEQQESTSTFIQIQESKSSQDLDQTGTNTEVIEEENNETGEGLNANLTEDFTKEDITTVHSQQYMHYELSSQTTDLGLTTMQHPSPATEHPDFKEDDGNSIEAIEKTNAEIQTQTKKKKKIGSTRRPHGRHQLRAEEEEEEDWRDLENTEEIDHQIITQAPISNLLTESQRTMTEESQDMHDSPENIYAFVSKQNKNISKENLEHPTNRESEPEQQESTSTFIHIQESKSSQDLDPTGTNTEVIEEENNDTKEELNAGLTEDFTKEDITTVHSQQYMHHELSSQTTDLDLTTMEHPSPATQHPDFKKDDGNRIEAIEKTNAEIQSQTKKKKKIGSTRRPHGRHQLRAGGEEEEWKDLENFGEIEHQILTHAPTSNLLTESQNSVSEDSHDIHDSPVTTEQKQLSKSEAETRTGGINVPPTILSTEADQIKTVVSNEVSNTEGMTDIIESQEITGVNEERIAESILLNVQDIQDGTFTEHGSLAVKTHGIESPDNESASEVGDFKNDDENSIETMETSNEEIHIQTKKKKKIGSTRRPHGRHLPHAREEEDEWKDQENTEEIEYQNIAQAATSNLLTQSQHTVSEESQDIHDSPVTTEQKHITESEIENVTRGINVAPDIFLNEVHQIHTVVSDEVTNAEGLTDIMELHEKLGVNEEKDDESMLLNEQEMAPVITKIQDDAFMEHVSVAVKKHGPVHESASEVNVEKTDAEMYTQTQPKKKKKFGSTRRPHGKHQLHEGEEEEEWKDLENTNEADQNIVIITQAPTLNLRVIKENNDDTQEEVHAGLTEDLIKEDITTVCSQQYALCEFLPQTITIEHPPTTTEHPNDKEDDGKTIETMEKTNAEIQTKTKKKKKIGSTRRPHGRHQLHVGGEEGECNDLENIEEIQIVDQAASSNLLTELQNAMSELLPDTLEPSFETEHVMRCTENESANQIAHSSHGPMELIPETQDRLDMQVASEEYHTISEEHLDNPKNRESEPEQWESTCPVVHIQELKLAPDDMATQNSGHSNSGRRKKIGSTRRSLRVIKEKENIQERTTEEDTLTLVQYHAKKETNLSTEIAHQSMPSHSEPLNIVEPETENMVFMYKNLEERQSKQELWQETKDMSPRYAEHIGRGYLKTERKEDMVKSGSIICDTETKVQEYEPEIYKKTDQSETSLLSEIEFYLNKSFESTLSTTALNLNITEFSEPVSEGSLQLPSSQNPQVHMEPSSPARRRKMGSSRKISKNKHAEKISNQDSKSEQEKENLDKNNDEPNREAKIVQETIMVEETEDMKESAQCMPEVQTLSEINESSTEATGQPLPEVRRKFGSRRTAKGSGGLGAFTPGDYESNQKKTDVLTMDDLRVSESESTLTSQPASEPRLGIKDTNTSTKAGLVSLDDSKKMSPCVVSTGGRPKIDFEQWNEQLPDFGQAVYNIVLVGNSNVGKTSFIKRLQSGHFIPDYSATVGVDTFVQTVTFGNKTVKLYVWDTAGQERYHSIARQVFHKAQGLLLMYDITSAESFHAVRAWISQVQENAPLDVILMLLGNKNDCANRKVELQQGENLSNEYNIHFMECSAATGENVSESLKTLAWLLVKQSVRKEEEHTILQPKPQNKKSGCC